MATASVEPRTAAANASSRRKLLSMVAFAPVAALPLPALASSAACPIWDRLMRGYLAAKAASDRYNTTIHNPTYAKIERLAPYPAMTFRVPDENGFSPVFRVRETNFEEWKSHHNPLYRLPAIEIKTKLLAHKAACERAGMDAIIDRSDALAAVVDDAETALLTTPAPHRAALLWKVERLFGEDASGLDGFSAAWSPELIKPLLADARRLLGDA